MLFEHDGPVSTEAPHEELHAVIEALQELPLMQRKAVVLRHMIGLSVSETADALGIAEGTVKSHTSRGLTALENALAGTAADWP